ncbi:DVUA0089 family protein [Massilia phyllosphaerae]|uniref:DVUA0089 family protein n=1 Tax=Massilia phyllosphaerae TaxID=3106034 RepID=UPI002B1CAB33|nr:DVUA0089 family protein [Massilia sp. SGZ-792]
MKIALFLLAVMLQAPVHAQATYEQSFNGHIELHNQVEYRTIPIYAGQGNLRVWTDSYADGANFDPIITVWHRGVKVAMNDNDATFSDNQSARDVGVALPALARGTYVVTITAYPNFPLSDRLDDGFTYDNQAPIPIDTWCQPGDPGPGCHTDRHFSLHWSVE